MVTVGKDESLEKLRGAFFWDYSGYSGLGIPEYTEVQFPKERLFILKTEYSRWR